MGDSSGAIGYSEFLSAMIDQKSYMQESLAREAFRVFDRDGDGCISIEEMRLMLTENQALETQMSSQGIGQEVLDIFKEVDSDGNGQIDFEEFMTMLRTMTK